MTNANDPSNAVESEVMENYENRGWYKDPYSKKPFGLTKREHFAAMAMANLADKATNFYEFDVYAEMAVKIADALIYALNKSENDN